MGLVDANGEPLAVGDAVIGTESSSSANYLRWSKESAAWEAGLGVQWVNYLPGLHLALVDENTSNTVRVEGVGSRPDSLLLSLHDPFVPRDLPPFEFGRALVKKVGAEGPHSYRVEQL